MKHFSGAKIAPVAAWPLPLPHAEGGSQGTGILRSGGQGGLEENLIIFLRAELHAKIANAFKYESKLSKLRYC